MSDENSKSAEGAINSLDGVEQMFSSLADGLRASFDTLANRIDALSTQLGGIGHQASTSGMGGMPSSSGSPFGGGVPSPPDMTSVMERLIRTVGSLNQSITDANKAPDKAPTFGSTKSLYSPGQIEEMSRHREQIESGRVNTDIPTFATHGSSLQTSPLSTLYRSNDLLGLNLGLAGKAKPGDYQTHDASIGIGSDLKSFLGKNESMIRTLQGSLSKSYEYSQNAGQAGDDYRNASFARTKMSSFYSAQEAAGTPIDSRTKGLFDVGLNERSMRDASILTNQAKGSLGRFISAHQSGALKYSPYVSLDSSGSGSPGETVSTRKVMKADQMGSYAAGLMHTMDQIDQTMTASDVKQSVVNDVRGKVDSVRDKVMSSVFSPDVAQKLEKVGVNLRGIDLGGIEKAQEAASNASNNIKNLEGAQLKQRAELNTSTETHGADSFETLLKRRALSKTEKELSEQTGIRDTNENIYRQGRSDVTNRITGQNIEKMSASGDPVLESIGSNTKAPKYSGLSISSFSSSFINAFMLVLKCTAFLFPSESIKLSIALIIDQF